MTKNIAYKIYGLDCSEEVAILKKALSGKDGISDLQFDVLNAKMTVAFEPETISDQQILSSIKSTGMEAVPWQERDEQKPKSYWQKHGRLIMTVLSAVFLLTGVFTHWYFHRNLLQVLFGGLSEEHVMPAISIFFYICAIVSGAWFVFPKAVFAVRNLRPDMNLMMVIAIIGAMILGEWAEGAMVSFLFALSLLLEHWSVERSRKAIGSLIDMAPKTARLRDPKTGHTRQVPVEDITAGTPVIVRPGEKIPLDGIILSGSTTVNQAPITGESMPVGKTIEDEVYAGTINQDGAVEIKATKSADDTVLARIIHMVEEAQSRRAPSQKWVDRFAYYYTPAMMILAAAIVILPPLLFDASFTRWFYRGLVVLVIACPCALVISTPVSIVSALTASARNGVLIKGGVFIEIIGNLKAIALDKTGTLTFGRPEVQQIAPLDDHTSQQLLATAAALEANSEHHLAKAILQKAKSENIIIKPAEDFKAIKGKGAEAKIDGRMFWIGSHRLMHERGEDTPLAHEKVLQFEDAGHTAVALGNEDHVCGIISIADSIRPHAPNAVSDIKKAGVQHTVMLTGDNSGTARAIAEKVGVDDYKFELLPEDKVNEIKSLLKEYTHVAMVGDGINDAPALAASTCGIAMGAMGTDAALETADIALMSDELEKIPWLIYKSRQTLKIIKQNVAFSLGLKILFITLTMFGLASLWMAIAADTGATLLVTFNALRLLKR